MQPTKLINVDILSPSIHKPHSNFINSPGNVLYRSEIQPKVKIALNCYVSLVFSMWNILSVFHVFHDLDIFQENSPVAL